MLSGLAAAVPVEVRAQDELLARDNASGKPLLRIMALGASITAGSTSNPMDGYRKHLRGLLRGAGYEVNFVGSQQVTRFLLKQSSSNAMSRTNPTGSMHDGEHEGYPGRRILEVRDELNKNGNLNRKPNVVLMHMGTNNCIQNIDLQEGASDIAAIADDLMQQIPGVTIIMSTLGSLRDHQDANNRCQDTLNPAIRNEVKQLQAAKKNVHIADFAANKNYTINDIGPDGIHPSKTGYDKLAQMWFDKIQRIHKYNLIGQPIKTQFSDQAEDDANVSRLKLISSSLRTETVQA